MKFPIVQLHHNIITPQASFKMCLTYMYACRVLYIKLLIVNFILHVCDSDRNGYLIDIPQN